MKFTNYILGICLGVILILGSCETTELDLTSNPNALSPEQADATFFFKLDPSRLRLLGKQYG
jgi:hypothetical protein